MVPFDLLIIFLLFIAAPVALFVFVVNQIGRSKRGRSVFGFCAKCGAAFKSSGMFCSRCGTQRVST